MRRYEIRPGAGSVPLIGGVNHTPWSEARVGSIDRYPWHVAGRKQATTFRVLYTRRALYLQFRCRDRHYSASARGLNGMVHLDSCVEFFAAVSPHAGANYFNLEINCCGAFKLGLGAGRGARRLIEPNLAGRIRVATSVPATSKDESDDDRAWWVAVELPFDVLGDFIISRVRPSPGDAWRGNFYRCGGRTDPQYACWNPIDAPQPDFHRHECFGLLKFA